MGRWIQVFIGIGIILLATACATQHEVEVAPVEVKPIHITIDVNIRVEKALDDFFGDLDELEESLDSEAPPSK